MLFCCIMKDMDIKEIIGKLEIQADLGRTPFGRDLGKGMVELTNSSIVELSNTNQETKKIGDCSGCGFISFANNYSNGCPNCGCKDLNISDVGDVEIK